MKLSNIEVGASLYDTQRKKDMLVTGYYGRDKDGATVTLKDIEFYYSVSMPAALFIEYFESGNYANYKPAEEGE